MKKYRVIYTFNHSTHGFQNSVTVDAITPTKAAEIASNEVVNVYGSKMLKRFTFKEPVQL